MDNTRRHPGDPDPKRELLDQNPTEHDETRRQGLVRPTNNSAKIDNLRGTPTRELGENSKQEQSSKTSNDSTKTDNPGGTPTRELGEASTRKLGSSGWKQQQWADFLRGSGSGVKNLTDRHGIELPSETDIKDIEGNVTGELEEMDSQRRAKALGLGLPPKFTKELRNQDIEAPQKIEVKQDFEAGDGDTTESNLIPKIKGTRNPRAAA